MNIDIGIANRALLAVGEEPLNEDNPRTNALRYRDLKEYYLQSFLEALSEVPWTGGMKRERLMVSRRQYRRNHEYALAYDLPYDCAKPLELQGNGYFVVEERFLYTNIEHAELLYVTNGKLLREVTLLSGCGPGELPETEYLSGGWPDTDADVFISGGGPEDYNPVTGNLIPVEPPLSLSEDYPEYRPPEYEPKFYEYVEKTLAAKLAAKLTGHTELHVSLVQEAMLIKNDAITASKSSSAAKRKPSAWWAEELGI
jgi:hypothetical protein